MAPPADKQHDAGQFNAWLTNLGPSKAGARPLPQRPPGAAKHQAQPIPAAKQGGLLGSVDDELDDIFGRITTEDAAPAAPIPAQVQTPAAAAPRPGPVQKPMAPVPPPRPAQEVPRPPARPQPAPQPQQAALDAMLARAQQAVPSRAAPPPQASRPVPRVPEPPQFAAQPQQTIQQPAPARETAAQVEAAVAEAKAAVQGQIKELQAKYQEQRQKWEGMLSDLRSRNDELHRHNQGLEEELAKLRERQRSLIMELSTQRATPQPVTLAPQPEESQQQAEAPVYRPPAGEEDREVRPPEISIEVAPQPAGGFMGGKPEATFEIPTAQPESPAVGEADDLLAELEALENEMKNLGGEGPG